jgi:predicted neuraminidase
MDRTTRTIYEISENPGLCHCSSIEKTTDGKLLCVWYQGAYEGAPGTAIRISKLPAGGEHWSPAADIFMYSGTPLGNPVLFTINGDNKIFLIFSILFGESWTESVLFISSSADSGENWSNPELLFPSKGLMAKTKPLVLSSGRVLIPLYDEAGYYPVILVVEKTGRWASGQISAETMSRGIAIQPALTEIEGGKQLMLCRTSRSSIWKSISSNNGLSWSLCEPTNLPNPDSALDLLNLGGGKLVLAFNDSDTHRHSLKLALSIDWGKSWTSLAEADGGEGEYSYPCLLKDDRSFLHLSYTEDRYRIKHFQFDLDWLIEQSLDKPLHTG